VAIDDPRARYPEMPDRFLAAERREHRSAERREHLGESRISLLEADAGGMVQGHRVTRGVETLEKAARLTRQPLPHERGVVRRDGTQECRCGNLCRVLELDTRGLHRRAPSRAAMMKKGGEWRALCDERLRPAGPYNSRTVIGGP